MTTPFRHRFIRIGITYTCTVYNVLCNVHVPSSSPPPPHPNLLHQRQAKPSQAVGRQASTALSQAVSPVQQPRYSRQSGQYGIAARQRATPAGEVGAAVRPVRHCGQAVGPVRRLMARWIWRSSPERRCQSFLYKEGLISLAVLGSWCKCSLSAYSSIGHVGLFSPTQLALLHGREGRVHILYIPLCQVSYVI